MDENNWQLGKIPLGFANDANKTLKWHGSDIPQTYNPKGNPYGPDDIDYVFNSHGYRSMEIDLSLPNRKIMYAGCSFVEGVGVRQTEIWTSHLTGLLSDHYGTPFDGHNFGYGGGANDFIAQVVFQALPILKPDLLVVLFTLKDRRTFHERLEARKRFLPHCPPETSKYAYDAYVRLSNEAMDMADFARQHALIDMTAKAHDVPWVWQMIPQTDSIIGMVREDNRILQPFMNVDKGRDFHPGPVSHKNFADGAADFIIRQGLL